MSNSIGSLNYQITADTSQLNQAAVLTKKEMREVRRVMEETTPPIERLQMELDRLEKYYDAGAISARQFEKAVENAHNKHKGVGDGPGGGGGVGGFAKGALGSAAAGLPGGGIASEMMAGAAAAGPAGAAIAGGLAIASAAAVGTAMAISEINAQMRETDEISDAAQKLGMSFADLNTARLSLAQSSGLDTGAIDNAMQKMQLGLAEANITQSGEVFDMLETLGLDAAELLKQGPLEAIKAISVATQELKNPTDQVVVAYTLFGKQGAALVSTLREGPEHIEEMRRLAEALGVNLSDAQAASVGAANDAWEQATMVATGFFRQMGAEFAPLLQVTFETIRDTGVQFSGWKGSLSTVVDQGALISGELYDVLQLATLTHTTMARIARLDFSSIGKDFQNAFDFTTGFKNLEKVQSARKAAEDAANAAKGDPATDSMLAEIERRKEAEKTALEAKKEEERRAQQEKEQSERKAEQERQQAERKAEQERQQAERKAEQDRMNAERQFAAEAQRTHDQEMKQVEDLAKKYVENYELAGQLAGVDDLATSGKLTPEQAAMYKDRMVTDAAREGSKRAEAVTATRGSADEYNIIRDQQSRELNAAFVESQKQTILQKTASDELRSIRKAIEQQKIKKFR